MTSTTATAAVDTSDRDATIRALRAELKARTGLAWSVTGGQGSAWGWIKISSPPKRRATPWHMTDEDAQILADAFAEDVSRQGVSIPASPAYRSAYLDALCGREVTPATPYWD